MVRQAGDERRVEAARWGWTLGGERGELINARSETAHEKPTFRDAVRTAVNVARVQPESTQAPALPQAAPPAETPVE